MGTEFLKSREGETRRREVRVIGARNIAARYSFPSLRSLRLGHLGVGTKKLGRSGSNGHNLVAIGCDGESQAEIEETIWVVSTSPALETCEKESQEVPTYVTVSKKSDIFYLFGN